MPLVQRAHGWHKSDGLSPKQHLTAPFTELWNAVEQADGRRSGEEFVERDICGIRDRSSVVDGGRGGHNNGSETSQDKAGVGAEWTKEHCVKKVKHTVARLLYAESQFPRASVPNHGPSL